MSTTAQNLITIVALILGVTLCISITLIILIKRIRNLKKNENKKMQEEVKNPKDRNSGGIKWRYSKKARNAKKSETKRENNAFKEVQDNVSLNDKSGLISFNGLSSLQLETEGAKNFDTEEHKPSKLELNLEEEAENGYIETSERQTDREASKFSIEFSRSQIFQFGNEDKDNSSDDEQEDVEFEDEINGNVLKGLKDKGL